MKHLLYNILFIILFTIFIIYLFYPNYELMTTNKPLYESLFKNPPNTPRVLLISASECTGKGYLVGCLNDIKYFFRGIDQVLFFPYALKDWDKYEKQAYDAFSKIGINLISIHHFKNKKYAIENSKGLFISGGNTFLLKKYLEDYDLIPSIRNAVFNKGIPYMGTSAGSNMTNPTIKTTNDMPIVEPHSFDAIGLVPFQINPHFVDEKDQPPGFHGETREIRIAEYHEQNNLMVIGIPERTMIWREGDDYYYLTSTNRKAKIFIQGQKPFTVDPNTKLNKYIFITTPL